MAFLQTTGSFTQTVTGWAAGSYVLTFDAAQRGNYQASRQDFKVLVDGTVISTFTPSSTSYLSYSTATFTVTAGSHTIKFLGLDSAGGDNTAFVDAVAVAQAGTPETPDAGLSGGAYGQRPVSGHVQTHVTNVSGVNAVISGLLLDGNPTSASGLASPISVMTPEALDATLRTSVLTNPVNRFERMLSEIAALRGRKLARTFNPAVHRRGPAVDRRGPWPEARARAAWAGEDRGLGGACQRSGPG